MSPVDVVLSFHDIVEPDLVFVAGDQLTIRTKKNIQGPPANVVEVVSKSTRRRDESDAPGILPVSVGAFQAVDLSCRHSQVALTGEIPRTFKPSRPPSPMSVALTDIR